MAAHSGQRRDPAGAGGRLSGLADFLLGFQTTAEPGVLKFGPQPYEGIESVLLQEFPAYTRETLADADWLGLERILDYRRASTAIELFNSGEKGFEVLSKRPDLMTMLLDMARAQGGADVSQGALTKALEHQRKAKGHG